MVTAGTLGSLHRLEDLPDFIHALGHQSAWEELPIPGWLGLTTTELTRAALVGRIGEFHWFGIHAPDAGRGTRLVARRMVARGRPAGVVAISSQCRSLFIAIAFSDPVCVECALNQPDHLTITRLARLGSSPARTAIEFAARAADVLSSEAVGRRFFRQFELVLGRMRDAMPRSCPPQERHGWVLLQLTRVLFLYFVQSKGWLDGTSNFLAREVDRCLARGRRLQRDLLRPLFFGTLNRPPKERTRRTRGLGRIPFLNGGLFEPHILEQRWRVDLPNAVWRDAFDTLFERFDFTADETGGPGMVAPDMLGRVFEGVMEPGLRRESGTFYTPATLVQSLVSATLVTLISERLGCGEGRAERYLTDRSAPARRALQDITVLDPAVGSGAFLLGTLDILSALGAKRATSTRARRRVLRRCLFGVDLNPTAVRLTELRLWLAVIANDPATDAESVEPLPNLDCLVRQGDSLFDPAGYWPGGIGISRTDAQSLARLRQQLVGAVGSGKRVLARELRRAEAQTFKRALDAAESALDASVAERLADGRAPTLFGGRRGLDAELRRELSRLRAARRDVRATRRRFARENEIPWFHFQSQFADVFANGGFDIVVGNPPWVRAEALPPERRVLLASRYPWWRSSGRGFSHRPDLSLAFLARGWELAREGGVVGFLVPAKLATAEYGARARHALAAHGTIHAAADLTSASEPIFDATVYPLALVVSKSPPPDGHRVRTRLPARQGSTPTGVPQRELTGGKAWPLATAPVLAALGALTRHPRLGDQFSCHLGVKTGANDLFLDPPESVEPELIRWAVRGRDVEPFKAIRARRLLWPCDDSGRPLRELPPGAKAFLGLHTGRLRRRADDAGGPPWSLFRTAAAAARYRVVWPDLSRQLAAVALAEDNQRDQIPLNTCYVIATGSLPTALRLAAWLNTTWTRAAARLVAPPAASGFVRFTAQVIAGLPLPDCVVADAALSDFALAGARGQSVQRDLDAYTARLLGLTSADAHSLAAVVRRAASRR